jgi:hypothetical protein
VYIEIGRHGFGMTNAGEGAGDHDAVITGNDARNVVLMSGDKIGVNECLLHHGEDWRLLWPIRQAA